MSSPKGLRQFLDCEQQRAWLEGEGIIADSDERIEALEQQSLEHRFKYAVRLEKLLRQPQAEDVLEILRLYAARCLPIPRRTERYYWSVSCLPSSPDKPLARINASWMELFTLSASPRTRSLASGPTSQSERQPSASAAKASAIDALRSRFILHLSDFTSDGSPEPDQLDTDLLESCAIRPEDMSYAIWRDGKSILIAKVRGAASIRHFLSHPHALRAIRTFNLTHMNRGRNAYQASHCYSLADHMLD